VDAARLQPPRAFPQRAHHFGEEGQAVRTRQIDPLLDVGQQAIGLATQVKDPAPHRQRVAQIDRLVEFA
jgi:hypothetical protein